MIDKVNVRLFCSVLLRRFACDCTDRHALFPLSVVHVLVMGQHSDEVGVQTVVRLLCGGPKCVGVVEECGAVVQTKN